ncbi:MAG: beta-ketoacyl-[acyl-carrier-protein] synthase family protein [Phycisphaerales bacterium]
MRRRVVITGLGVVSPFGLGVDALWDGLLSGSTALKRLERFDPSGFPSRLAGEIPGLSVRDLVPKSYRKAVKVMARDTEIAVAAASLAVKDGRLVTKATIENGDAGKDPTLPTNRLGCHIGAGLIAAETDELTQALATARDATHPERLDLHAWGEGAINNLGPLWMLKYLPNMLACHVTILHDAQGPSNTITCAESSGLLSIGESMRVIERGDADVCFTGGAESKLNYMGFLRMDLAGRLAHTGDEADPLAFTRPFDEGATGQLLAEGGAILLAEGKDSAERRGAKVYAELAGFGAGHSPRSGDAADRAQGLVAAIERAIEDAGVAAADIDAVVPHGAGVRGLDDEEAAALRQVFGARLKDVPLVTITPNIGDTMAGQSALQAAAGALCVHAQTLPARRHGGASPADLAAGASKSRDANLRNVLVCTNALGGQNAALVLRRVS